MIKRYTYLGLLGILPFLASAQITNNGATIVIEEGATLVVEAGINNISGAITNSGTIRVKGDFINDGTLSSTTVNSDIIFEGTAPQIFDANGATVRKVTIMNTMNNVSLAGTGLTITENLTFGAASKKLDIAGQNLNLGSAATITRGVNDGYIVAAGTGKVVKTFGALGSFTFPVGDGTVYSPLSTDVTAGTIAAATLAVNLKNSAHPSLPSDAANPNRNATEYITRYWDIDQAGFGTGFSANVLGTYDDTDDVVQTSGENLIKAAFWDGTEWAYDETDNTASNQVGATITGNRELTGSNTFGKSMVSVMLEGVYQGGGLMSTTLNTNGILQAQAMSSPYGTGEVITDVNFFANNPTIVDWIKLELRDGSTPSIILASRSAFLSNSGQVLDIDGSNLDAILFFKNSPKNSFVAITHRNHLLVRTAVIQDLFDGSSLIDFSSSLNVAYNSPSITSNDPMLDLGSGVFALFSGNATGDNLINVTDFSATNGAINPNQANVYSIFDLNLDGNLNVTDFSFSNTKVNPNKSSHE